MITASTTITTATLARTEIMSRINSGGTAPADAPATPRHNGNIDGPEWFWLPDSTRRELLEKVRTALKSNL